MDYEKFKNRIIDKFGNNIEIIEYIDYKHKVKLKCNRNKLHDEVYEYSPQNILRTKSSGCPFCDKQKLTDSMIRDILFHKYNNNIVMLDSYIYGVSRDSDKFKFNCSKHGEFYSTVNRMKNEKTRFGCLKCSEEYTANIRKMRTLEDIHEKLKVCNIDIDDSTFSGVNENAVFICDVHGRFTRKPGKVLYNNRISCPYCGLSNGEAVIRNMLIEEFNFIEGKDFFMEYKFEDLIYKKHLRFDFYLNNNNVLIEFDGKQHHSKDSIYNDDELRVRDDLKDKYCKDNNIHLIRFRDNSKDISRDKISIIKNKISEILTNVTSSTTIEIVDLY